MCITAGRLTTLACITARVVGRQKQIIPIVVGRREQHCVVGFVEFRVWEHPPVQRGCWPPEAGGPSGGQVTAGSPGSSPEGPPIACSGPRGRPPVRYSLKQSPIAWWKCPRASAGTAMAMRSCPKTCTPGRSSSEAQSGPGRAWAGRPGQDVGPPGFNKGQGWAETVRASVHRPPREQRGC
jgi:hypothetical protein